jgi:hypothetical protein
MVHVDLVKEAGKPLLGYGQPGALESRLELLLVQPAVLVAIDGPKQEEELPLGGFDEDTEFWTLIVSA